MTSVTQLISATPYIPFANEAAAQAFLNQYDLIDQAALISALYIGRDHIHNPSIHPDYVPIGYALDRFFHTGDASNWLINPSRFAGIMHEKDTSLSVYYHAFSRCMPASSLTNF